jgi:anti-sigma regulatory factor (Ser/Thr protein kinase)
MLASKLASAIGRGVTAVGVVMEFERSFPLEVTSVGRARRFVDDVLRSTPVNLHVVRLLTSELAANAVLHARSGFRVHVRGDSERVRVQVINHEPELLLAMAEPSVTGSGGRGLRLVEGLSLDWGVESSSHEKVVWFEVPTSGSHDEPARKSSQPYGARESDQSTSRRE